jgi:hypothetical protein
VVGTQRIAADVAVMMYKKEERVWEAFLRWGMMEEIVEIEAGRGTGR